jgi:CrcB protein
MLRDFIIVFFGGGLGSLTRFGLGRWVNTFHNHHFPLGTLTVNVFACFALGFAIGLADHRQLISPTSRLFWTVGFCGGFSTFSTFSSETWTMIQSGFHLSSIIYIVASLVLCLVAVIGGIFLGSRI